MNHRRILPVVAVLGAISVFAQDAVLLRRELKSDAKDVYKIESTAKSLMEIPSMGEQELNVKSSMNYTLTTSGVAEGKADLNAVMSDIKYEMSGPMADMMQGAPETPKELKFKGKIDHRSRITDFKVDGQVDMMTMMMSNSNSFMSFFIEFPEYAVKVGDTWPVVIPKNPLIGNEESTLTAKFVGEKDGMWDLSMSGDLKINGDLSELMKGQDPTGMGMEMKMKITGSMKMSFHSLVDKVTGKTVQMTTDMDSNTVTDIENLGLKTTQKSKGTVKYTLQR